jgi:hypothetical protein
MLNQNPPTEKKKPGITINVNPEIVDDIKTLNDPKSKIILNDVFTDTEVVAKDLHIKVLSRELVQEIKQLTNDYDDVNYRVVTQLDKLGDALTKLRFQQSNDKVANPGGKLDLSFLDHLVE